MKKITLYVLILITLIGFSSPIVKVSAENSTTSYQLLAPLPCPPGASNCNGKNIENINTTDGLGAYLNPMITIFIGLCAVLSVVMIVVGGLEYMTSELSHSKEAGKEKIMQAVLGLIIALGAWALLNTINPDLLKSEFNPGAVTSTVNDQSSGTCDNQEYLNNEQECKNSGANWTPTPAVTPATNTPSVQPVTTQPSLNQAQPTDGSNPEGTQP